VADHHGPRKLRAFGTPLANPDAGQARHLLPALPYDPAALEPHIDARTMMLHHDRHHAGYVETLNAALEMLPELRERTAVWLLLNLDQVPQEARTSVRNSAGGHVNHSMLWRAMSPDGGGAPTGVLADAIERDFGGVDQLKRQFDDAGAKVFGCGWVWLARVQADGGELKVLTTVGHDNPLMHGHYPLLVNDVWEHAYYLKHEDRRADYMQRWWSVVNWPEAARRYEISDPSSERRREGDGGLVDGGFMVRAVKR
jgi:superoxide dismutase, Fe-Mn family